MLAGPNGSGKSTLFGYLEQISGEKGFHLGQVLNPDVLEQELADNRRVDLAAMGIGADNDELATYVREHALFKRLEGDLPTVEDGILVASEGYEPGYFIPVLCDLLRDRWMASARSFSFETVMSSESKIDLLRAAGLAGYRTYLYYIFTEAPQINLERIVNRVATGGHDVPYDKVESRYERSLLLLWEAIRLVDRAYLFDNSG
jgi:predicted ABC-type ATPase